MQGNATDWGISSSTSNVTETENESGKGRRSPVVSF